MRVRIGTVAFPAGVNEPQSPLTCARHGLHAWRIR
jgi:hypothetical protein